MAKTKTYRLSGKLYWAKLFESNKDNFGPNGVWEEFGGCTTVNLKMDKDEYEKFKKTGSRLKVIETDDGHYMVKFRRKWINEQHPQLGGPPVVVKANGEKWDLDRDGLIGNESEGVIQFSVYDTRSGKGTRLDGVLVKKHVPYERPNIFEDLIEEDAEGETEDFDENEDLFA